MQHAIFVLDAFANKFFNPNIAWIENSIVEFANKLIFISFKDLFLNNLVEFPGEIIRESVYYFSSYPTMYPDIAYLISMRQI